MKQNTLLQSLMLLDNAFGVSGDEEQVAAILKQEMEGLYDEYDQDALGSQYFIKHGKDPQKRVLISAHMDEIGFILNHIEDNGMGRFLPVGYHDDRTAVNQVMVVKTDSGALVKGVTGSKPFHLMETEDHTKVLSIADLFLDFGTESREETLALGVQVGDYIGFDRQGFLLNGGKYFPWSTSLEIVFSDFETRIIFFHKF